MFYQNEKDHFTCYRDKGWDLIKELSAPCTKVLLCLMQANNIRQEDNALIFRNNGKALRQIYVVKETGLSESTVSRCMKELEDNGIITKRKELVLGIKSNVYFLNPEVASIGKLTKQKMLAMPAFFTKEENNNFEEIA